MEALFEKPEEPRPHLVSILVHNRPGVLARVAALFSARGYNIEGLTAAHAETPEKSRITCVTWGDSQTMERIVKQLRNLVEVIGVSHGPLEGSKLLGREMLLVRLAPKGRMRQVLEAARKFEARVVSRSHGRILLEATGSGPKLASFLKTLELYGVEEVARSGPVVMVGHRRKASSSPKRSRQATAFKDQDSVRRLSKNQEKGASEKWQESISEES